jgi:hypothetical protein
MNGTVPAPPPLAVGLAALAGLLLLLAGVALSASSWWPGRARDDRPEERRPARRTAFADDDLPGFLAAPPGTPGPIPAADEVGHRPVAAARRRRTPLLVSGAVAVLLLGALVAALAWNGRGPATAGPSTAASSAPSSPPPDVTARATTAGLVLTRVPVGVVAGFPQVSLSTRGDRATAHLDLPTADCLSREAPPRAEEGGCQPTATESGDLGTPALRMTREAGRLTLSGRFATRLGTDGPPTGRSYDVTVTVDLPRPSGGAPLATAGTVRIGSETAPTLPDPGLTTVTYRH